MSASTSSGPTPEAEVHDAAEPSRSRSKTCGAPTSSGQPCPVEITMKDGRCFAHTATVTEDRRAEVRERGGRNSSKIARLERRLSSSPTLGAVVETVAEVMEEVRAGTTSPAVGNSVASLSRALVGAMQEAENAERLRALEEILDRIQEGMARESRQVRGVR